MTCQTQMEAAGRQQQKMVVDGRAAELPATWLVRALSVLGSAGRCSVR
jgi:hypothetical protein